MRVKSHQTTNFRNVAHLKINVLAPPPSGLFVSQRKKLSKVDSL